MNAFGKFTYEVLCCKYLCDEMFIVAVWWSVHINSYQEQKVSIICDDSFKWIYSQVSNIKHTLVGNWIVDHSYVVGTSPVGAAPTTSSFST